MVSSATVGGDTESLLILRTFLNPLKCWRGSIVGTCRIWRGLQHQAAGLHACSFDGAFLSHSILKTAATASALGAEINLARSFAVGVLDLQYRHLQGDLRRERTALAR